MCTTVTASPSAEPKATVALFSLQALNQALALATRVIEDSDASEAVRTDATALRAVLLSDAQDITEHAACIGAARDSIISTDDIEIDDRPILSIADEGVWVNAWLWVPSIDSVEEEADTDVADSSTG